MQDIKNLLLAFLISLTILTVWDYFFVAPKRQQMLKEQEQQQLANPTPAPSRPLSPELQALATEAERTEVLTQSKADRIRINTPSLHGSISLVGARIDDLTLAGYNQTLDPDSPEVVLFAPSSTKEVYFAEFGWVPTDTSTSVPTAKTRWSTNNTLLTPEKPVELYWDNGAGVRYVINIAVDKDYLFTVTQRVENNGTQSIGLHPYGALNRAHDMQIKDGTIIHQGPMGVFADTLEEVSYKTLVEDDAARFKSKAQGWLGFADKYWLSAIFPEGTEGFDARFAYLSVKNETRFQVDYVGAKNVIAPGSTSESKTHLFAGAKKVDLLDQYAVELNRPLLDRAVDFGRLYFLTKPLFIALTAIHAVVGNMGIAILVLTVCVKLLMFPLANKSYRSFAKMKKFSPQLMEIREQHKDDRMAQNQAMMALYKKEGVNPLSGCLPLLIQIPVFFALYKVLNITIEMRHAPFFGWLKDLSMRDPTSIFNLFGLLPWDVWPILTIGVLPILMAITMAIQQRLNPPPADPVQAKVMKALPWIFMCTFSGFPSGLVLYWVCNNTLSIIQQWIIIRGVEKEK